MIIVLDNYDSFVYNLVQYARALGHTCLVRRNDAITVEQIADLQPELLLISPGPGRPAQAGICLTAVQKLAGRIPILGVCLGHQVIAEAFGGKVTHARRPMHGKRSRVFHDGQGAFTGLPNPTLVTRYHSLVIDPLTLPDPFVVTAVSDDAEVMAIRHRDLPIAGVQFHPESIFTEHGITLLNSALTSLIGHSQPAKALQPVAAS
jgi:anthranilate synthase/aminodeoxychorismate synthase-like glutamine amidotransferase